MLQVDLLVIRDRLVAAWLEGGGELNEQEVRTYVVIYLWSRR